MNSRGAEWRAGTNVALLSATGGSLILFRGELMRDLIAQGHQVLALAPDFTAEDRAALAALGATPVTISLDRTGLRPGRDLLDLLRLCLLFRQLRPEVVLAYFIKPVIYGSLAARLAGVPRRFAVIAGLGYVFTESSGKDGFRKKLLRSIVSGLYKAALSVCHRVFFLNRDDLNQFVSMGLVPARKVEQLPSEGVDTSYYALQAPVCTPVRFLIIARLLREKGIREFVEAARYVHSLHPEAEFHLVGGWDPNPGAIPRKELDAWLDEGIVKWHGEVKDVRPWIVESSVFVLPSYREGKPRSTQEAMAMGRPVITTDAPGCRDTVEDGANGYIVPVRDSRAVAEAMLRFISDPSLIAAMGQESRRMAEAMFDVRIVNRQVLVATDLSPGRRGTVSVTAEA